VEGDESQGIYFPASFVLSQNEPWLHFTIQAPSSCQTVLSQASALTWVLVLLHCLPFWHRKEGSFPQWLNTFLFLHLLLLYPHLAHPFINSPFIKLSSIPPEYAICFLLGPRLMQG
jgi:hypothetical protein